MIERILDAIVRGVGHVLMIPALVAFVIGFFLAFGLEITNVSISILTLLLLPVLQRSQLKGDEALHAKIDELVKAMPEVSDDLIRLEERTEVEIKRVRDEA